MHMVTEAAQEAGQSLLSNNIQEKTKAQGGSDPPCIIRDKTRTEA